MSFVSLERNGVIATVTLNRPERLNALGRELLSDFHSVLTEADADPALQAIVLTGAGRAFCAGDDLKEASQLQGNEPAIREHIRSIQQITRDLMYTDKIVIGAVHGYAVGGGFEWMLNCDMVVAADDLVAFLPESEWAYFVTGGITHLLPRAIGHQRAMELMVLGERQSAKRLLELGLVNWVVTQTEMLAKARDVAERVVAKSSFSVGHMKRVLTGSGAATLPEALVAEERITIEAFLREEPEQRVATFFQRSKG